MSSNTLRLTEAKAMAVYAGLTRFSKSDTNLNQSVLNTIKKLGYLQIDTLSVVRRAHEHTLWQRTKSEIAPVLDELLAKDRKIFEYWGHAASYLPMQDYRFYLRRMKLFADPKLKWEKHRVEKYSYLIEPILKRLASDGPLSSGGFHDLADDSRVQSFKEMAWGSGQVRMALDMMANCGLIMVTRRDKFKKVFDLTERVVPEWVDLSLPTNEEFAQFFIQTALRNLGVATQKDILQYIDTAETNILINELPKMVEAGTVLPVTIEGSDTGHFILANDPLVEQNIPQPDSGLQILSPFDNFVILRDRLRRLFNFDYALECYVPAKKRKFGYFVLPLLYQNDFIGRMDAKADQKSNILHIHDLYFEAELPRQADFPEQLKKALTEFAEFNNCKEIQFYRIHTTEKRLKFAKIYI